MARKRKTLPKDFAALLEEGTLDELKAVFDKCELDARGGVFKQTALAFDLCPDELARWLVEQGADLAATDHYGNTPLHSRARSRRSSFAVLLELGADVNDAGSSIGTPLHAAAHSHNAENTALLVQHGAQVDVRNKEGLTPLELALRNCQNINIAETAKLARILLDAGAEKTPRMAQFVEELGQRFEFHRSGFNPEFVDEMSDGLDELYAIFEVTPVPRREIHDGKAPIVVKATTWQKQHEELWELLVPSRGAAATVQGEVIRIPGRLSDELYRNGGANWNRDYSKMADALLDYVQSGKSLTADEIVEMTAIVAEVKRKNEESTHRMSELAVKWVMQNLIPVKLKRPAYDR